MNQLFLKTAGLLLLMMSSVALSANEEYRIAGIIAQGTGNWRAIVELPSGEQKLVSVGDTIADIEVAGISKDGVTLKYQGVETLMQLSQGDYFPQTSIAVKEVSSPVTERSQAGNGIEAARFSKLLFKRLAPDVVSNTWGLDTLNSLSDSARIVSYAFVGDAEAERTQIKSLASAVNELQQAIVAGKELRISVEGDDSFSDFYLMPRNMQ